MGLHNQSDVNDALPQYSKIITWKLHVKNVKLVLILHKSANTNQ